MKGDYFMGVMSKDVNYEILLRDIELNCMTEETCGACQDDGCLIGYTKKCISDSLRDKVTYIEDGVKNIPHDMRAFDRDRALDAIAHILRQCKSCEEDHFDDCLINVIRSCYEIITMGEEQKYTGSIFMYLSQIKDTYSDEAEHILREFQAFKG